MKSILVIASLLTGILAFAQPQKEVKTQIDSLAGYIKTKYTEAFAIHSVYTGADETRKWKDVCNPANPEELKAAKSLMEKMKFALYGCNFREFDSFKLETKSEGTWYIFTYACGASKKIHFSFLKIKGKYALGDVDVEQEDE